MAAKNETYFREFDDYNHPWSGKPGISVSDILAGKYDRHIAKRNLRLAKSISPPLTLDLVKTVRRGGGATAGRRATIAAAAVRRPALSGRRSAAHPLHLELLAAHRRRQVQYTGGENDEYYGREASEDAHEAIRKIFPAHANMAWLQKMYGAPPGYKAKIHTVEAHKEGSGHSLQLDGDFLTNNGRRIGNMTRYFTERNGHIDVEHAFMGVNPKHSGRGFGHSMMAAAIKAYGEMGVRDVTVGAANLGSGTTKSHGPAAWAHYFDFDSHSRLRTLAHFKNWLTTEYGPGSGNRVSRDQWGNVRQTWRSEHGNSAFTDREIGRMVSKIHHPWDIVSLEDPKVKPFPEKVFNHPSIPKHYDKNFTKGKFREVMSRRFGRRFLMGEANGCGGWHGVIHMQDRRDPALMYMRENEIG